MKKDTTLKETVHAFLDALNKENFDAAATYLREDMQFDGVMGKRDGADAYIADMRKMKFKYDIIKIFEDGNDVCVLYNIDMGGKATIYTAGWYHLSYGKIQHIKVVFDPAPLK